MEVKPPAKVEIYTYRFSSDCVRAKGLLDRLGLTYNEFIIDDDEINNLAMMKRSGGCTSVPQIFIDGIAIGGYAELEKLNAGGELAALLRLVA
ncbi:MULTISPECIES: glutaredoxin domain-containing protein [unclassified Cyanobium]|uniref:glutaredoxin domain-containing protein n=1 Tax=unclassified Cyanobium TaxID=2627006 RepID=UPI0028F40BBE|nr:MULTISPECIES: glutaredoxin domain-containing protein [unclassified Cyanobium]